MPLPTFVVIGAAKCGTTSLCDLLAQHPEVFFTRPKEPHYFSRTAMFEQGREWYASLYRGADRRTARGEGSTSYTHPLRVDIVVPRLYAAVPDAQLIYMVRHPIRRIESDWKMRRHEGRAFPSINETIENDASLVMYGMYWRHLSAYRRLFRDPQILVVFFEDFVRDPVAEMAHVYAHIGVDPTFVPEDAQRARNAAADRRTLNRVGAAVRRIPGFRVARRLAPRPVARAGRLLLTRGYNVDLAWDPSVMHAVSELYRDDAAHLLMHCGKPADYWKWNPVGNQP